MNFGLNLWNKIFYSMFGFIVILFMTPSGHSWIINKIKFFLVQTGSIFLYPKLSITWPTKERIKEKYVGWMFSSINSDLQTDRMLEFHLHWAEKNPWNTKRFQLPRYSSNRIRKTQIEHLNIICQNLIGL